MVTEIIDYVLVEGSVGRFHSIMINESLALHEKAGIEVAWYGQQLAATDRYCLIRRFPSEDGMEQVLNTFYASPEWRQGPREGIVSLIVSSNRILLKGAL